MSDSSKLKPTLQACKRIIDEINSGVRKQKKIISLQGSARSGKTYNVLIWLMSYCLENPGTRLSIVRKTLPAIRGSVFVDFKEILIKMGHWNPKCFNKTELLYTFPNGSWVEFFSTDDEQKIRGRKRKILFCNEANEISETEWTQLRIRTTGLIILDYNPSFSEDHWLDSVNKEATTHHFISTYNDNPFLEQTVIDAIESLKTKNKSLWMVYGLGLRAAIEGRVFERYEIVDEIPAHVKRIYIGLDFGYAADPSACAFVGIYANDLYIDELFYKTHMLTGEIIRALKPHAVNRKVISESADPRLVDEIHNAGINIHPVEKPKGSIEAGITAMQQMNIYITKRSYNAKKEFDNYVYEQDKNGKYLNTPVDALNHIVDLSRYVVYTEVLGKKKAPKNAHSVISGMFPG